MEYLLSSGAYPQLQTNIGPAWCARSHTGLDDGWWMSVYVCSRVYICTRSHTDRRPTIVREKLCSHILPDAAALLQRWGGGGGNWFDMEMFLLALSVSVSVSRCHRQHTHVLARVRACVCEQSIFDLLTNYIQIPERRTLTNVCLCVCVRFWHECEKCAHAAAFRVTAAIGIRGRPRSASQRASKTQSQQTRLIGRTHTHARVSGHQHEINMFTKCRRIRAIYTFARAQTHRPRSRVPGRVTEVKP